MFRGKKLLLCLFLLVPDSLFASTFDSIYLTNSTGTNPKAALVQATNGMFYGTTTGGGSDNQGTIFQVTPSGVVSVLFNFNGSDGGYSTANLIQGISGDLYGTSYGGPGTGDIFQISTTGTETVLYNFALSTGSGPSGLIQDSVGNIYGTTGSGGGSGDGTAFEFTAAGSLVTLANFDATKGSSPFSGLILGTDGYFYGTTYYGGSSGNGSAFSGYGTIFKLQPGGAVNTVVNFNNTNGSYPRSGLIEASDNNLYGTTQGDGNTTEGTVFRLTLGGQLTTLVTFDGANGSEPEAGLMQGSDGNLYGTTGYGGVSGAGTVFQVTPSGSLTTLFNFNENSYSGTYPNGETPSAGLIQSSDGNLYGTTRFGGQSNLGTIFRLNPGTTESVSFGSPLDVPITTSNYTISGSALSVTLNYAPAPGTVLTVIHNTQRNVINGTFTNLPNGATITVTYKNTGYTFTANYSGNGYSSAAGYDLTLTLPGPATDTPLLPEWALMVLVAGMFTVGCVGVSTASRSADSDLH